MRILVADSLSRAASDALAALGAELNIHPDATAESLPGLVGDADVLIVRSTKVTRETIEAGESLALIVRAGAGTNTINTDAASRRGIAVANCPGMNTDAVAELTIGLIIAADRQIVDAAVDLRSGRWKKKRYSDARGLKGRTLGIVGLGAIGLAVARRAAAFGMTVGAWSRSLSPEVAEQHGITRFESLVELARSSDVVSVHLAAAAETRGIISQDFFAAMNDGAIFVNTSRGDVVDHDALRAGIETKGLRAALDVFDDEPAGGDAPFPAGDLAAVVTGTPHIGASTDQAADAIASEVVRIVSSYAETGRPVNTVNVVDKTDAPYKLVVRHYNRVGVLAAVLGEIRTAGINVEEMENRIFSGGVAASCRLKLAAAPPAHTIAALREIENVIQVLA